MTSGRRVSVPRHLQERFQPLLQVSFPIVAHCAAH